MDTQSAAGFGPVLFIGLTFAALVTHTPPNPDLPNPMDSADFEARPEIVAAAVPILEVPVLALEQQITRLAQNPIPETIEADGRVAAPPVPDAILAATYPDMPDQFQGFETQTTLAPEINAQVWATTQGPSDPSMAVVSTVETAPQADTQSAPVTAADTLTALSIPPLPETAQTSIQSWTKAVLPVPSGQLPALLAERVPAASTDGWATVTGNFVNMRTTPDLSGARIVQFFRGNRLIVTQITDGWARVNQPSNPPQTGWMSVEFLELELR